MFNLSTSGWKRGGAVGLLLATGLVMTIADRGRTQDPPAKIDFPAKKADDKTKADDKSKADDATKPDDSAKPEPKVPAASGGFPQTQAINQHFVKFWAANNARPSRKATDYEFVRRLYLDVLGRIPAVWEVQSYVNDPSGSTKKARLIQKLLHDPYYREEYESHWADVWTTLLLSRSGNKTYHAQMHEWLEVEFGKNAPWDVMVRTLLTAKGENQENGEANYILAHLGEPQKDKMSEGQFDAVPITSRTTRLFLGLQIQCAQCHNHPFNPEWKQHHFWGVNAFFRQVEREGTPLMRNNQANMASKLVLKDNSTFNPDGKVFFEDRQAVVQQTAARFLDGKKPEPGMPRREALGKFVTEHEMFPKAFVNRMWGHFFGRSMTQNAVVDDFGEHNQVVHAELLDSLGGSFKDYKFNIKELIAWICNSEPYALSVEANPTNNKPEHEVYFSRMLLKNMNPETLYASLKMATDQSIKPGSKPSKAVVKPGNGKTAPPPAPAKPGMDAKAKRAAWLDKLTKNFGDDEGNEITFNGTVVQALMLMNGKDLQDELSRATNNTVANAMQKSGYGAILNELTIAAVGRPATAKEMALIKDMTTKKEGLVGTPQAFWEDVLWTLLNSNEFVLNH